MKPKLFKSRNKILVVLWFVAVCLGLPFELYLLFLAFTPSSPSEFFCIFFGVLVGNVLGIFGAGLFIDLRASKKRVVKHGKTVS